MEINFNQVLRESEKTYGLGKGEYLRIQEGDNRIRLLSEAIPHESYFKGNKTFKYLCYVLDRADGVVKPYFMPYTIFKDIAALQMNPDYEFKEVPMPYDVTIVAKGAGTKSVDYSVIPSPKHIPLTKEEQEAFEDRVDIKEFQKQLNEKQAKEQGSNDEQELVNEADGKVSLNEIFRNG